jgi:hypothetical protein
VILLYITDLNIYYAKNYHKKLCSKIQGLKIYMNCIGIQKNIQLLQAHRLLFPRKRVEDIPHTAIILKGKNLQLIKNKLIAQTWRGAGWDKNYVDSTFIICLKQKGNDVVLYATHANVPDTEYDGIDKGWHVHYWEPWKKYLAGNRISESITM